MRLVVLALVLVLAACQTTTPPPSSTQLTVPEVTAIAHGVGFACVVPLLTAVAIAIAESSLCPGAINIHPEQGLRPDGTPHMDRGLWQVSSYSWPGYTDAETFDPVSAASIAFELSDGGTDFGL